MVDRQTLRHHRRQPSPFESTPFDDHSSRTDTDRSTSALIRRRPWLCGLIVCLWAGSLLAQVGEAPTGDFGVERVAEVPRVDPDPGFEAGLPALRAESPRNANYRIDATYDPTTKVIDGSLVLTWRNIQSTSTAELSFHLYWNAWRNDQSTWLREDWMRGRGHWTGKKVPDDAWAWQQVDSFRVGGDELPWRYIAPDDGNEDDRTVFHVDLPRAVSPGEEIEVEIDFRSKVPRTFARVGFRGDYVFAAHWFPKLGVFTDDGWVTPQFHSATEFFSDYGRYDVALTVPAGWTVGATGRLVAIEEQGETATHRFEQNDVHGFAWTASPDFISIERRFERPGLPEVDVRLLVQPDHLAQADRLFDASFAALESYGTWYGPYPYDYMTVVDPAYGSRTGGMEYPTFYTCGTRLSNPLGSGSPEGVTIHEAGHQFWYGVVGSNEFDHAWIDEGFNTFSTSRTEWVHYGPVYYSKRYFDPPGKSFGGFWRRLFPGLEWHAPTALRRRGRLSRSDSLTSDALAVPTWKHLPHEVGNLSYSKTALWLTTLERWLGWEKLQRGMSIAYRRGAYRAPTPEELFAALEEGAERDLDAFFDHVYYRSALFDYAVEKAGSRSVVPKGFIEQDDGELGLSKPDDDAEPMYRTDVVVRRHGDGVFPVDILLVYTDGNEERVAWDGEDRWHWIVREGPAKLERVVIDPDRVLLLDLDWRNNSRLMKGDRFAARAWAARWAGWVQDLFLTVGGFL
ncbi:MAG: M1 family metallopeptidase [Acidobacteriota bacterium]